jgi:hypothetical protein
LQTAELMDTLGDFMTQYNGPAARKKSVYSAKLDPNYSYLMFVWAPEVIAHTASNFNFKMVPPVAVLFVYSVCLMLLTSLSNLLYELAEIRLMA